MQYGVPPPQVNAPQPVHPPQSQAQAILNLPCASTSQPATPASPPTQFQAYHPPPPQNVTGTGSSSTADPSYFPTQNSAVNPSNPAAPANSNPPVPGPYQPYHPPAAPGSQQQQFQNASASSPPVAAEQHPNPYRMGSLSAAIGAVPVGAGVQGAVVPGQQQQQQYQHQSPPPPQSYY
jgi:hypothetical protein